MTDPILLNQEAFDRLKGELGRLLTEDRQQIAKRIQEAREDGDLKENGAYHAAKEEQGKIESRINRLEEMLANAEIGSANAADGIVKQGLMIGCRLNGSEKTFYLGNHEVFEGTPHEQAMHDGDLEVYSSDSPIGRQIIGRTIGETVSYQAPNGRDIKVEITAVSEFEF